MHEPEKLLRTGDGTDDDVLPADDDGLNRLEAKTNAANETNKEPTDGSGTTVSTHTPGSADVG